MVRAGASFRFVAGAVAFAGMAAGSARDITIDETATFQTMRGFGASLTESSAAAIGGLSEPGRQALMAALFSPEDGAGLSLLRQPMGASDFRLADYTYDDAPVGESDTDLARFSIVRDTTPFPGTTVSIVSLLKEARAHNPSLHLMASPWTAPGWMKIGTAGNIVPQTGVDQRLYGGTLSPDPSVIDAYARYFVKFVEAYAAEGLAIDTVTLQNEPFFNGGYAYPSMTLDAARQRALVKAIGNAFDNAPAAGGTEILVLDHNWSDAVHGGAPSPDLAALLDDPEASSHIAGVAFHGYGGDPSAQQIIHDAYPEKSIWFTEQTGTLGSNWGNDLLYDAGTLVVDATRARACSIVKFNLALDETGGPKIRTITFDNGNGNLQTADSGFNNGRGVVTIHSETGEVSYNQEYYALAHIAKFVRPGAVRIGSDWEKTTAFRNPDGSLVVIACNADATPVDVRLLWKGKHADTVLPARSLTTFHWSSLSPDPAVAVCLTTADRNHLLEKRPDLTFIGEGSAAYRTWIRGFFPENEDDNVLGTNKDPDGDGETNLMEFLLAGVPNKGSERARIIVRTGDSDDADTDPELLVTIAVRSGTPAFAGTPSPTATSDGARLTILGSKDLQRSESPVVGVGLFEPKELDPLPPGYEYRTFSLLDSNGFPDREFLQVEVEELP